METHIKLNVKKIQYDWLVSNDWVTYQTYATLMSWQKYGAPGNASLPRVSSKQSKYTESIIRAQWPRHDSQYITNYIQCFT